LLNEEQRVEKISYDKKVATLKTEIIHTLELLW
jgi:hypothetical protein